MTTYKYKVTCSCGHFGFIKRRENDPPSGQLEIYLLQDLEGSTYRIAGSADWDEVFAEVKPRCPKCQASLSPSQLTS